MNMENFYNYLRRTKLIYNQIFAALDESQE